MTTNYLESLTNAALPSTNEASSSTKMLVEELYQPILSSKAQCTQLDTFQVTLDNPPVRYTSPMDEQSRRQDESIFTTSSNNRYSKHAKAMNKSYSRKRSHSRQSISNVSQAYDNSDLSDIDRELSVSKVRVPPAPAVVRRTPYQQSNLNNIKVKAVHPTMMTLTHQINGRKSLVTTSNSQTDYSLKPRPQSRQQRNLSITDTISSLQKKNSRNGGNTEMSFNRGKSRDTIFNTTSFISKSQIKTKAVEMSKAKWRF